MPVFGFTRVAGTGRKCIAGRCRPFYSPPRLRDHMLISVVMPTYRRPHTLPRAVASVLAQNYTKWELIVVNNDAADVAVPADQRIRLYRHAETPGASYARNAGLRYATGDAVCFLDDDDMLVPSALGLFAYHFGLNPLAQMVRAGVVLANCEVSYELSTPAAAVRREYATPTWDNKDYLQDQRYWQTLIRHNGWVMGVDIVRAERVVCVAFSDPKGGLRVGAL